MFLFFLGGGGGGGGVELTGRKEHDYSTVVIGATEIRILARIYKLGVKN